MAPSSGVYCGVNVWEIAAEAVIKLGFFLCVFALPSRLVRSREGTYFSAPRSVFDSRGSSVRSQLTFEARNSVLTHKHLGRKEGCSPNNLKHDAQRKKKKS
ncbi:hypothetical protein AVEN_70882-1 [Araneus ventricosus]|uniref:Uncharacterized protein n=1 Tax=Araneus ventricosus TaxID=182803 RepID=A0A4Y2L7G0_ARAVE|nr:hypothetical protein AVEN_70882-1 [Araneus ventricosus]